MSPSTKPSFRKRKTNFYRTNRPFRKAELIDGIKMPMIELTNVILHRVVVNQISLILRPSLLVYCNPLPNRLNAQGNQKDIEMETVLRGDPNANRVTVHIKLPLRLPPQFH